MNRTAILLVGSAAVVGLVAPHSLAAPPKKPKPITKTYTATAPNPDPTNFAGAATGAGYSVCAQNVPGSFHTEVFKVPAAGTLKIDLHGYVGDWDLLLMDDKNEEVAFSGLTDVEGAPEVVAVKYKKAGTAKIVACNWAGAPTGEVTYTFTFK